MQDNLNDQKLELNETSNVEQVIVEIMQRAKSGTLSDVVEDIVNALNEIQFLGL